MIALADLNLAEVERVFAENGARVLWPLVPLRTYYYGDATLTGLYVDCEATSLDVTRAEIIEFACARFTFSKDGEIGEVVDTFCSYEQPSAPIPPEITTVTGITDDDVRGAKIDDTGVADLMRGVDLVVAHNPSYDRPILERRFPRLFDHLVFGDSWTDVDWKAHGFACGKLAHLLIEACGVYYRPHRALDDVLAGIHLLAMAQLEARPAFAHLLDAVKAPTFRFRAWNAPYERKDELKARGYRWDDAGRVWWKDLAEASIAAEREWFAMTGICVPTFRRVKARDRFTERAGR